MQKRIKNAVEFLKDGNSFSVDNLMLGISDEGGVVITGWSLFRNLNNITKASSIDELNQIKVQFYGMIAASIDLKDFVTGKCLIFQLWYDTGYKSSLPVCTERNGIIEWEKDLPE